jgi:hypothetical protein
MSLTLANGYTVTFVATAGHGSGSFSPGKLTRVTLNQGGSGGNQRQRISIAHLNEPFTMTKVINGESQTVRREEPYVEIYQPRASGGGGAGTLDLDFIGSEGLVRGGVSGTLTVTGAGLAYSNTAVTCSNCQLTLAVGDIVKGSASFALPAATTTATCDC